MKLRNKLIIATVLAGVFVAAISALLVWSVLAVNVAANNMARATQVVNAISDIRFLTFENLLNHDQTSHAQWERENTVLANLLQPSSNAGPDERATLQDIARLSGEIKPLFDRLVAAYGTEAVPTALQQQLQERLASQILVKQQTQISEMLQLESAAQSTVIRINTQASLLVGTTVIFMVALTIGNFVLFTRGVTRSLDQLLEGAREITARHFGFRIKPRNPDDEFGQVAKAFNSMAAATGKLDQAKSEFVVLAAHQLKTPMAQLKGYVENLTSGVAGDIAESKTPYLREMEAVCDRAFHLIDNLLDISQIERGTIAMAPAPLNLRSLVDETLHMFRYDIETKGLTLHVVGSADETMVVADPLLTIEALKNIIHNAVKFTDMGSITVTLSQEDEWGTVTVTDTGIGVSAAARKELFRTTGMLGDPLMSGQGAKLGLYVAHKFLALEGGSITLLPSAAGAVFQVKLPRFPDHAPDKP